MRLKRYSAPTMADALRMIKTELGEDAVILSTRKVKGPDGKPGLEITAAVDAAPDHAPAPQPARHPADTQAIPPVFDGPTGVLGAQLLDHGLTPALAQRITRAAEALGDTGFTPEDALEMVLGKMIRFQRPGDWLPKGTRLMLVGPTGAGKTTTLAKLAVQTRMAGRSIGLITLDTYKIGAVEQLGIYADALKEDLRVVPNTASLAATLEELKDKDVVFIDSAGINPFERSRMADLQTHLAGSDVRVALVLPSNLNSAELVTLPRAFAALNPGALIVSKMDETAYMGGVITAAVESGLPVCYATDGQRVPQDLLELDATSLSRKLLQPPRLPWEETGT